MWTVERPLSVLVDAVTTPPTPLISDISVLRVVRYGKMGYGKISQYTLHICFHYRVKMIVNISKWQARILQLK